MALEETAHDWSVQSITEVWWHTIIEALSSQSPASVLPWNWFLSSARNDKCSGLSFESANTHMVRGGIKHQRLSAFRDVRLSYLFNWCVCAEGSGGWGQEGGDEFRNISPQHLAVRLTCETKDGPSVSVTVWRIVFNIQYFSHTVDSGWKVW